MRGGERGGEEREEGDAGDEEEGLELVSREKP